MVTCIARGSNVWDGPYMPERPSADGSRPSTCFPPPSTLRLLHHRFCLVPTDFPRSLFPLTPSVCGSVRSLFHTRKYLYFFVRFCDWDSHGKIKVGFILGFDFNHGGSFCCLRVPKTLRDHLTFPHDYELLRIQAAPPMLC